MPEFNKTPHAIHSPTKCILCNTHEGPFIDTGRDTIEGHVYICCSNNSRSGCIHQMAILDGCLRPEVAQQIMDDLTGLQERNVALQEELFEVMATKTLTVDQIRRYIKEEVSA